ncbi:MAG: AAA family ATPase [Phycisphaerales bacterium JB060]
MRTIAIVNQKGGCGKTTTAISLSGALAARAKRVLLVDMDPQSHCAAGLAIPEAHIEMDIGDAMLADRPSALDRSKLLWRIGRNLDLLPSRMRLAGLEATRGGLATLEDKEQRLAKVIASLDGYDFAIIDCSPSIGLLTYNALCAADEVLIPVEMSYFSQQGASRQVATLRSLGQRLGRQAKHWIVPTIHEPDAALPCELLEQLRGRFGTQVCQTVIHKDDKVKEAATFGRPVGEYAPQSQAALDYADLAEWVLGNTTQKTEVHAARSAEPWTEIPAVPPSSQTVAQVAERARRTMSLDEPEAQETPAEALEGRPAATTATGEPAEEAGNLELERLLLPKHGSEAFGIHAARDGVWLVQPIGLGRAVAVAGAFNNWSAQTHRLDRYPKLGVHARKLELPPGRHAYRLVVDGFWTADPFNPDAVTNPFGEPNSIAEVPDRSGGSPGASREDPQPAA